MSGSPTSYQWSQQLLLMSQALTDFRLAHTDTLDSSQQQQYRDTADLLLQQGEDALAQAASFSDETLQAALHTLADIGTEMSHTLKVLSDIQTGINLSASLVQLAGAILSKNPEAMLHAAGNVVQTWKNKDKGVS